MEKNKLKLSIKTLQQIFSNSNEPEWFTNIRKQSLYKSYTLDFPKLESMDLSEWHLFNIDFLNLVQKKSEINIDNLKEEYGFEDNDIVVIQKNNDIVYLNIPEEYNEKIVVKNIFKAMSDEGRNSGISSLVDYTENRLTAAHYALLNAGLYIEVKDNVVLSNPVQYIVLEDSTDLSLFNHLTVNIGKNAECSILENYTSLQKNDKPFSIITEVIAEENSKINYSSITNLSVGKKGTILRRGLTNKYAIINWNIAAMDEADVYQDNTTNIIGNGSESNLKIVTLGVKKQKTYFNSELVNQGLNTNGDILQHGVLLDESHIVFNGVGFIVKGATESNAYQSSRMLTLSNKAKANANPMLLIDENDVAAGHGASLGRIDDEQLYYLQSRGLTKKESSRLLVHGFLSPVIKELTVDKIKQTVINLVDEKITNNESE